MSRVTRKIQRHTIDTESQGDLSAVGIPREERGEAEGSRLFFLEAVPGKKKRRRGELGIKTKRNPNTFEGELRIERGKT